MTAISRIIPNNATLSECKFRSETRRKQSITACPIVHWMAAEGYVTLEAADGFTFIVPEKAANGSGTLKDMLSGSAVLSPDFCLI